MAMKLLPFHDKLVADLSPNHKKDDLGTLYIIQRPEISHAKLELGQGIWPQSFDGLGWRRRVVL